MTEYVEVARAESERGEVVLRRASRRTPADVLELRVNGVFVMDTHETTTEVELAAAALELVADPRDVVVGGLGLGFTPQRVLADPRVEQVDGGRDRGGAGRLDARRHHPHGPALLADKRRAGRQRRHRDGRRGGHLDLRPGAARRRQRPGLPGARGQRGALRARLPGQRPARSLNPGGALVVWSANPAPQLAAALEEVFGSCTEHRYDVLLQERSEQYLLYLSRRT